jgi:hypothetical protein
MMNSDSKVSKVDYPEAELLRTHVRTRVVDIVVMLLQQLAESQKGKLNGQTATTVTVTVVAICNAYSSEHGISLRKELTKLKFSKKMPMYKFIASCRELTVENGTGRTHLVSLRPARRSVRAAAAHSQTESDPIDVGTASTEAEADLKLPLFETVPGSLHVTDVECAGCDTKLIDATDIFRFHWGGQRRNHTGERRGDLFIWLKHPAGFTRKLKVCATLADEEHIHIRKSLECGDTITYREITRCPNTQCEQKLYIQEYTQYFDGGVRLRYDSLCMTPKHANGYCNCVRKQSTGMQPMKSLHTLASKVSSILPPYGAYQNASRPMRRKNGGSRKKEKRCLLLLCSLATYLDAVLEVLKVTPTQSLWRDQKLMAIYNVAYPGR